MKSPARDILRTIRRPFGRVLSRDNLIALGLCLLIIVMLILSANTGPTFLYRQF